MNLLIDMHETAKFEWFLREVTAREISCSEYISLENSLIGYSTGILLDLE